MDLMLDKEVLISLKKRNPSLARMFHELPAATADVTALPGVLGCRTLRRNIQVRLGIQPPAAAQWCSHLHGLVTATHETSGLEEIVSAGKDGCGNKPED